jgi:hypothetical protein
MQYSAGPVYMPRGQRRFSFSCIACVLDSDLEASCTTRVTLCSPYGAVDICLHSRRVSTHCNRRFLSLACTRTPALSVVSSTSLFATQVLSACVASVFGSFVILGLGICPPVSLRTEI